MLTVAGVVRHPRWEMVFWNAIGRLSEALGDPCASLGPAPDVLPASCPLRAVAKRVPCLLQQVLSLTSSKAPTNSCLRVFIHDLKHIVCQRYFSLHRRISLHSSPHFYYLRGNPDKRSKVPESERATSSFANRFPATDRSLHWTAHLLRYLCQLRESSSCSAHDFTSDPHLILYPKFSETISL